MTRIAANRPLTVGLLRSPRLTATRAQGVPSVTFPGTPGVVRVWLAFGADPDADPTTAWAWTEVTDAVRGPVTIWRGRRDEQASVAAQTATLVLANEDHRFSPRNTAGPYYGQLRRNTPIKITYDPGVGDTVRYIGLVPQWEQQWQSSLWAQVAVTAAGVWRQVGSSTAPIESAMRLTVRRRSEYWSGLYDPDVYWPLEDGDQAGSAASLIGDSPMVIIGQPGAAIPGPAGSAPLLDWSTGARAVGQVPPPSSTPTTWTVECVGRVPELGTGETSEILRWTSAGTVSQWSLRAAADGEGGLTLVYYGPTGATTISPTSEFAVADAQWRNYSVWITDAGGLTVVVTVDGVEVIFTSIVQTIGPVRAVHVNGRRATTTAAGVGHVLVYQSRTNSLGSLYTASTGYSGDEAPLQWGVVMALMGRAYDAGAVFDHGTAMGAVTTGTLASVLTDIEASDGGMIVERLDGLLHLRSADSLQNQTVAMTLDYTTDVIDALPTDDDQTIVNYATVQRVGGSDGAAYDLTGPLGVDAIGRREVGLSLSLAEDWQAAVMAGWPVTVGTVDEYRWPKVAIDLGRSPTLAAAWLTCDVGSRIQITGLPTWLTPDTADLLLLGYQETISAVSWQAVLVLAPYWPWRTAVAATDAAFVDDNIGYCVPTTCVLAEDLDTTETGVDVTSTPLWSTDADDYAAGLTVTVGGERMTVTAVAGASNPQTLTVTRSANGVVKTHSTGAAVAVTYPGIAGL